MDDTCSYQSDGQRCVLRPFHPVRHHRLANGWSVAITDTGEEATEPNPELTATGACVAALEDLPDAAQARVLAFLAARFGNPGNYIVSPGLTQQLVRRELRRITG